MEKEIINKFLALGIIVLIVGIVVNPAVAVNTKQSIVNSQDDEDCNCSKISNAVKVSKIEQPFKLGSDKILYVGGSGPENYTKIQDALNDAIDGDIVFVYKGIYYENLMIDKSINLRGENRETTIIDANISGNGINIIANAVNISRFTIQKSKNWGEAIAIIKVEDVVIFDNIITNSSTGILVSKSSNNIISNNLINNNYHDGITFYKSSKNIISRNNISSNRNGIWSWAENYQNIITDNSFYYNLDASIDVGFRGDIISNNTCIQNGYGISGDVVHEIRICENTITQNLISGIFIEHLGEKSILSGNTISNNTRGIEIITSRDGNTLLDNIFINGGLFLSFPSSLNLYNNLVNDKPLVIFEKVSNRVLQEAGQIILIDCENISITNLDLSNTDVGVTLFNTNNCLISKNNIINNNIGIYLYFSSENKFYKNNFINNGKNVNFELDYSYLHTNSWVRNYFDNKLPFVPKVLVGRVRSRFKFPPVIPGGSAIDLYRPGFNFDWCPALRPYDI